MQVRQASIMKLNIACEDVMSLDPNTYVRTWVYMTMRMHMHLCLHKHMHVDAQVHTSMDMHNAHTFMLYVIGYFAHPLLVLRPSS